MDIKFRGVTLAFVLWYVLPGLNFLVINLVLPIAILSPDTLARYSSLANLIVLASAALVVGFVMDSLKLYQFTLGYSHKKAEFFKELGRQMSISSQRAREVFDSIRTLAHDKGPMYENISLQHSRWVMINHTSKCFYLLFVIWIGVLSVHQISLQTRTFLGIPVYDQNMVLIIDLALAMTYILIGVRLSRISSEHLELSNKGYLRFVAANSDLISDRITPSEGQLGGGNDE